METDPAVGGWLLRAEYTFMDGSPTIDDVDRMVKGRVRHLGGGVRHALGLGSGPWKTHLEWEFDTLRDAHEALIALGSISEIHDAHVVPTETTRILRPDEYQIRPSDALAGKAVCPHCRSRIEADLSLEMAVEGAAPGSEAILRCGYCGLHMGWVLLPEDNMP